MFLVMPCDPFSHITPQTLIETLRIMVCKYHTSHLTTTKKINYISLKTAHICRLSKYSTCTRKRWQWTALPTWVNLLQILLLHLSKFIRMWLSMVFPWFCLGVFKTRNGEMTKWQYISVFRREKEMYVSNVLNLQRLCFKIRSKPARKHSTHLRYIVN